MLKRFIAGCTALFMLVGTAFAGGWTGITDGNDRVGVTEDGTMLTREAYRSTPLVLIPVHSQHAATTLAQDAVIDTYTVTVTDATNFHLGDTVAISDPDTQQVYFGELVAAPSGNILTVDRPFDFTFVAGKPITCNATNMSVDGSVSTQVFSVRNGFDPGITLTVDVARLMFTIYCATAADLSTFGDIATGLTNGVTIRRRNGNRVNIINIKRNGDLAAIAYDLEIYSASNPNQGQDGVASRLTFTKIGGIVRLGPGEDLEVLINDNLSTLQDFTIIAEGYINVD